MSDEQTAISVLRGIAMDNQRVLAERQRAIDALTLFHDDAVKVFEDILRRTDNETLKERAELYIQRFKAGSTVSFTL